MEIPYLDTYHRWWHPILVYKVRTRNCQLQSIRPGRDHQHLCTAQRVIANKLLPEYFFQPFYHLLSLWLSKFRDLYLNLPLQSRLSNFLDQYTGLSKLICILIRELAPSSRRREFFSGSQKWTGEPDLGEVSWLTFNYLDKFDFFPSWSALLPQPNDLFPRSAHFMAPIAVAKILVIRTRWMCEEISAWMVFDVAQFLAAFCGFLFRAIHSITSLYLPSLAYMEKELFSSFLHFFMLPAGFSRSADRNKRCKSGSRQQYSFTGNFLLGVES